MVIGSKASIYKVTSLPPTGNPDSIYFLKLPNEEIAEIYITDINGAFTPSGNKQFVQEVFDSMSSYLVKTDDERLINAREWIADVVSKSDAELGISSERFVWTALRDRQATEYHFNDVSSGFGRLLLKSASAASVRDELQLGNTVLDNYGTTSGTVMQGDDSRVLNAVGRDELYSRLNSKVDKEGGKSLTDENFTLSEKQKLASLESSRWRGLFVSITALPATATAGDYADVDSGASADIQRFIWDNSDSKWVAQSGVVPPITGAQVKALYEAQPDTNAFTDAEKSKLSGVALNATKNATDAQLKDRATHTGFQPISTITNLQSGLDSKVGTDAIANIPSVPKSSAYTATASDKGKSIDTTAGVTFPASVFAVGDVIVVTNTSASNISITPAAGVTFRLAGLDSTGLRTLAGYGVATLRMVSSNVWFASGAGLS